MRLHTWEFSPGRKRPGTGAFGQTPSRAKALVLLCRPVLGKAFLWTVLVASGLPASAQIQARGARTVDLTHGDRRSATKEPSPVFPAVGSVAPSFDLPELSGKQFRLDDLRGKNVLLNFWAFWCDTWKEEMPHLRELAGRQKDLNFRIVAVSVDGTRIPEFHPRATSDLSFPVLLDVGGRVTASYHVEHVPTVVLLDGDGRVRYTCVGWPGSQVTLNHLRKLASTPYVGTSRATNPGEISSRSAGKYRRRRPGRR
jgi:peroxiredoxin